MKVELTLEKTIKLSGDHYEIEFCYAYDKVIVIITDRDMEHQGQEGVLSRSDIQCLGNLLLDFAQEMPVEKELDKKIDGEGGNLGDGVSVV